MKTKIKKIKRIFGEKEVEMEMKQRRQKIRIIAVSEEEKTNTGTQYQTLGASSRYKWTDSAYWKGLEKGSS